jgi:hypothetical protein
MIPFFKAHARAHITIPGPPYSDHDLFSHAHALSFGSQPLATLFSGHRLPHEISYSMCVLRPDEIDNTLAIISALCESPWTHQPHLHIRVWPTYELLSLRLGEARGAAPRLTSCLADRAKALESRGVKVISEDMEYVPDQPDIWQWMAGGSVGFVSKEEDACVYISCIWFPFHLHL